MKIKNDSELRPECYPDNVHSKVQYNSKNKVKSQGKVEASPIW